MTSLMLDPPAESDVNKSKATSATTEVEDIDQVHDACYKSKYQSIGTAQKKMRG